MITIDNQKQCSKCKEFKPATNGFFGNHKTGALGLFSSCKDCRKETNRKWKQANLERYKETSRKWREANPEKVREHTLNWREKNPGRVKELNCNWRENNQEKMKELQRKWLAANHEKASAQRHKRRALIANAAGTATAEQIKARFQFHENRCYYCGDNKSGLHIEHRIPLSRGGSNWPANLVPACPACNMSKGKKTEKEFLQ